LSTAAARAEGKVRRKLETAADTGHRQAHKPYTMTLSIAQTSRGQLLPDWPGKITCSGSGCRG
jgi:hypothetical protein